MDDVRRQINRLSRLVILTIAFTSASAGFAQQNSRILTAKVDERVELLSIVFRLAGSREYSQSPLESYTKDIDTYFAPYKNHPVVVLARQLSAHNDVGYNAVMAMAIHLSRPPELQPLLPFSDDVPEKRWGKSNAVQFANLLRDFYRDTDFERFTASHRALYRLAEERFSGTLESVDLGWFARFYGEKPIQQFHVLLGLNNGGGNYGIKVRFTDKHQEAYAIMGCWSTDARYDPVYPPDEGYLETVIHEFNHSFVNPVVERNWTRFKTAAKVFEPVADQMRSQAYARPETMVDESLVRAAVLVYSKARGTDAHTLELSIRKEQANGFVWMEGLVKLLDQYQTERGRYRRFEDFMPVLARFYDSLAPRMDIELARFRRHCIHVNGMQPFANHDQAVNPALRELIISFDQPVDPTSGAPLKYGPNGKREFPVSAKPEFLPGNKAIKLQLALKPNHRYAFEVSGATSADGYPVLDYAVDFQTRDTATALHGKD